MTKKLLFVTLSLLSIYVTAQTSIRYWVGGSGSWDNPAKWSTTSGGAGGALVPLSTDSVVFDAASGSGTVTIPAAATSLAQSITFTATAMNKVAGTGRLDVTSHLTLQAGMNLTNWTGVLYFYTPASVAVTRTITTNNNTFRNSLIQFEKPSSGTGGNVVVNGNFNHGGSSCVINLQSKVNTVSFNNVFTFGGIFDVQVGTANMRGGFAWYRTYVQAFTGALNSWGSGTGDEFHTSGDTDFNAGNTIAGNNYAFRTMEDVYTPSTYSGTLSVVNCSITISYRWQWASQGGGTGQTLNAAGSTIRFISSASAFNPRDFNYHTVICDNDPGNSFMTFQFGTFYFSPAHTNQPNFNNLILDRNMSFRFSQSGVLSRCYPTVNTLMQLTPGHRYIYSSDYSEAIGTAFRFNIPNGSTLDMQGLCTYPIWLQKMAWEFGATATILSDNIKADGIYAADNTSPYAICAPTKNIGANSYNISTSPTSTYAGWNLDLSKPVHRNLVWVGSIPAVTTNTAQYGNWFDENNWVDITANPTWTASALIAPGNPSLSPACPPTHRDSVIFPNNSYVNCDRVISYCEGMNWQGSGRLYASPGKEMEIWGSLYLSTLMKNDFNGTFWFKSDRTYRCWITTNNQAFDLGVVFKSDNGNGSWELRDTLKVPNIDGDANGFYNGGSSFKLIAGHLHTGNTPCVNGNGQVIEAYGMHLNGGAISLYDSDVYIKGDIAAGSYVYYVSNSVTPNPSTKINAGTSNLIFIDSYSPGSLTNVNNGTNPTQKAYLGWGKRYYDITLKMPATGTYVDYTHFINLAMDTVRRIVAEAGTMPEINTMDPYLGGDTRGGVVRMIDLKTTKLSEIKVHNQSYTHNGVFTNTRSIIIDSLQAMGNINFGQNINIRSYLKFQPGSTYALGSSPTGATAITVTLSATTPTSTLSYETCPVTPVGYGPATFSATGTCTNLITILNGTFVANSTNTVNVSYANITDNVVTGANAPFNYNNSNINNTTGWTGTSGVARKLRWKDVSGITANSGDWNNSNNWELVVGGTTTQTVIAPAPQCPPTRIDTAIFDNTSFTANNQRVNVTNGITDVASMYWQNITAGTNPQLYTAINTNRLDVYGSLVFHLNMQQSFAGPILFRGSSTYGSPSFSISTITCAKKAFNNKIDFFADGPKVWSLQDSLTALNNSAGISYLQQAGTFNLVRGEFRTNGNPMYIGTFNSNSAQVRKLDMTNSIITVNYGFTASYLYGSGSWIVSTSPNSFSVTATGSTINFTHPSLQGIVGGGKKYNNINFKNFSVSAGTFGAGSGSSAISPSVDRDTFNVVKFIGTGTAYIGGTDSWGTHHSNYSRFTKVEANCPIIIESSNGEFDTLIMNNNGTIRSNQRYNKYVKFSPARIYNIGSGTIQWYQNRCQVDLYGFSGSNIQLYSTSTSVQAYFRKDSAYMCTDFINMRDIWAIGNGNNPVSCNSFTNTGVNTLCPPIPSYTTHAVSLCDTIVDNASSCGPWDLVNLTRGRSDFNAGTNADLQGNDAGWVKRGYPPTPVLNLTSTAYSICPGDAITLNMTGIANPPFTLFYIANGVTNNYTISSTAQLAAYNPTTSAFTFTTVVTPTVNTQYTLGFLIIDRCFNPQSATGTGTVNVLVRPTPSGIASNFSPSALVCSGAAITLTSSATNGSIYTLYSSASGTAGAIPMTSYTSGAVTNGSITISATGNYTAATSATMYTLYAEAVSQFGCPSSSRAPVVFTVNPIPSITNASLQTMCTGNTATITVANSFTNSVANSWTSPSIAGITGHATSGSSNTITETLINTTANPIDIGYTYTPFVGSCAGTSQVFTVTVYPAPIINSTSSATICSGSNAVINFTSNIAATTYQWIGTNNANTTGESITTQTTSVLNNTITSSSNLLQIVNYTVTPTATLGNCVGVPQTITVNVNPSSQITSANTATICSGNGLSIGLTANVSSTYTWVAANNSNVIGESTSNQTTSTINNTLTTLPGSVTEIVIYTVTPSSSVGNCLGPIQTITVSVNSTPTVAVLASNSVCANTSVTIQATGGSTYTWTPGTNLSSPTGSMVTFTAPTNTAAVDYIYNVITTNTVTGCSNVLSPQTFTLHGLGVPVMTSSNTTTICSGANANLVFTASSASTYSWLASNNSNTTGESLTTQTTSVLNNTITSSSNLLQIVNYTVTPTATLGNCVGVPQTITVNVNPSSQITSANTATICSGNGLSIGLTANVSSTYTWVAANNSNVIGESTSNQTTSTINNTLTTLPGSVTEIVIYTVTPSSSVGNCLGPIQTITVSVNSTPTVAVLASNSVCANTSVTIQATGGSTYTWSPGTNLSSPTGSMVTFTAPTNTVAIDYIYNVITTNTVTGCSNVLSPQTFTLHGLGAPVMTSSNTTTICSGTNANLVFTASSASTYSWLASNNSNTTGESLTPQITVTLSDAISNNVTSSQNVIYTVTPTSVSGNCLGTPQTVTVNVKSLPTIAPSTLTNVTCFGLNNGQVTFTTASGTPGYTVSGTNISGTTASGLSPGAYTYTLIDAAGCVSATTLAITQPTAVLYSAAAETASNTSCISPDGVATVTITGGTANYTITPSSGSVSGNNITGLGTAIHSYIVTDANGCTVSNTVQISGVSGITSSISSQHNVLCFGNNTASVTITGANEGSGNYGYTLTPITGTTAASTNTIGDFTNLSVGTYSVLVKGEISNCVSSQNIIITQPTASLSLVGLKADSVICNGGSAAVTLTASGGTSPYTYVWSANTSTTNSAMYLAGNYSVSINDDNGCSLPVQSFTVLEAPVLIISSVITTTTGCGLSNGTATLNPLGGWSSLYTYTITDNIPSVISNTNSASGLSAGSYVVTLADALGCLTNTVFSIANPNTPTLTIVANPAEICIGQTVTLSPLGAVTYTLDGTIAFSNSVTLNPPVTTVYQITGTDIDNCNSSILSITVTVNALPVVTVTPSQAILCASNTGTYNATGADTYIWTGGVSNDTYTINAITNETVSVIGTNTLTGCISSMETITVNVSPIPLVGISSQNNVSCFGGNNGAVSYTTSALTSSITPSNTGLTAGSYTFTIVDELTTCSNTMVVSITEPVFSLSATITNTVANTSCTIPNGAFTVTAVGGTPSYTYNGNNTTGVFTGQTTGAHTVIVMDENACAYTLNTIVSGVPTPSIVSIIPTNVLCYSGSTGSVSLLVSGGTPLYTFAWSNGATIQNLSNVPAGSYTVTVTDAGNCQTTGTITLTEPTAIQITTTAIEATCQNESTGSATISIVGGTPNYSVIWSNGATGVVVSQIAKGNYQATVTDNLGCINTLGVAIPDIECETLFIPEIFSPNGDSKNEKFEIKKIEAYPNNALQIFNRWGSLVYTKQRYSNEWDGRANVGDATGKALLPAGTYYVILEFGDAQTETYKGFVQLEY